MMYVLATIISGNQVVPLDADGKPYLVNIPTVRCAHNWQDVYRPSPWSPFGNFSIYLGSWRFYGQSFYYVAGYGNAWWKIDAKLKISSDVWVWDGWFEAHSDGPYLPFGGVTVRQALSRVVTTSSDMHPVGAFVLGAILINQNPSTNWPITIGDSVALEAP